MIKEIGTLAAIALGLGILLALANQYAEPRVRQQQVDYKLAQLKEVVGDGFQIQINPDGNYDLVSDDKKIGVLEQLTTNEGYNGEIRFWLATTSESGESTVLGARVISHNETPGLGDKLELAVSDWILDFNAKSLASSRWDVKKHGGDFDQFTGATITPRALVRRIETRLLTLQTTPHGDKNG